MDNIVDILRLGISGFAFLLALMGYRLLTTEQTKPEPNPRTLTTISRFMWQAVVLAVVVGAFGIWDATVRTRSSAELDIQLIRNCRSKLELLLSQSELEGSTVNDLRNIIKAHAEYCLTAIGRVGHE